MKKGLFYAALLILLMTGSLDLNADESGLNPTAAMPFAILSPADKEKFLAARTKALYENPDLKAEGEDLKKDGDELGGTATPEERQAFNKKVTAHQQKLRTVMLLDDPTLQPIFDQFDKKVGEMRAEAKKKVVELYEKKLEEKRESQNSADGAAAPANGAGSGNPGQ